MNKSIFRVRPAQALIVLALAFATTSVHAQRSAEERRNNRSSQQSQQAQEAKYPNATRQEPEAKSSSRMSQRLQKMIDAYNKDDPEGAKTAAQAIIADDKANAYDKSLAYRIMGAAQIADEPAAAIETFRKALETNGLNNNDHYETMWMVVQLLAQEDQMEQSLAQLETFMSETGSNGPEQQGFKGVVLYQLQRYPEAIEALNAAVAASDAPQAQWQQLLMASYAETDQTDRAVQLAEQIAAKTPDDRTAQLNLAGMYINNSQDDKALVIYERLRAAGQLTEERDYRNLMAMYLGAENREAEAIGVINEGLEKQILKPDHTTYSLLAQAYYFSDQMPQAIEAYQKAAPLAPDGEAYLNLAKTLWAEGRIPEAKQAARQAIDKGIKSPKDAQTILSL